MKVISSLLVLSCLLSITGCSSGNSGGGVSSGLMPTSRDYSSNTKTYPGTYVDQQVWDDIKRDQGVDVSKIMPEVMRGDNYNSSTPRGSGYRPDTTDRMIQNSEIERIRSNAHLDSMEFRRAQNQRKAKSFCVSDLDTCR